MARRRSNPLALAVLYCLLDAPMHPYEVATTLRRRAKDRSVKLYYGALYAVVESLAKRGLIAAKETERAGRLPERTIYELTDAGRAELGDWLADLVSTPVTEYTQFVAALSLLAALPPERALGVLKERLQHLTLEEAQAAVTREMVQKHGLPRLLWVDEEYRGRIRVAEIDYVRSLVRDIEQGTLEGAGWWAAVHEQGLDRLPVPFDADLFRKIHQQGD